MFVFIFAFFVWVSYLAVSETYMTLHSLDLSLELGVELEH